MRIAFVVEQFPSISETFILNQITGLIDLGHNVDIFAFTKSNEEGIHPDLIKYNLFDKVTYFDIPEDKIRRIAKTIKIILRHFIFNPYRIIKSLNYKKWSSKYYGINNLFKLEPFLRKKYHIIHCHFGYVGNEVIFIKRLMPNVKFFVTFHGYDIRLGLSRGRNFYKDLFKSANYVISICNYNTQKLKKLGCPNSKIIYHPNGIDFDKFTIDYRRQGKKKYFVITTIARFVDEKNIAFALDVIKALKEKTECELKYYLIGDGPLREDVERRISELNLEHTVDLFGFMSNAQVREKLLETDVFFLSSKSEAFPTVLLEAQAMELPIITMDVGGAREALRENVSGFIISKHYVEEVVDRFSHLIEDSLLIKTMGTAGRRFVKENFDIKRLNDRLVNIYDMAYSQ